MAQTKFLCACLLLIVASSHIVEQCQGRPLMLEKDEQRNQSVNLGSNKDQRKKSSADTGGDQYGTDGVIDIDGFRPTTPGHSPGVGHSVHN
ncbi:hypothetical protein H6P81_010927 [Aristolochia fimbriata]|uniref:Uncharacterized protein n=1 Tax=Aristolochia fimbriata TaxID=158543 RepID=A0AAV7ETJ8_ARIFI|nr:hypothetical protein H6P81_010927 [Aristolochia fimbriata]